LKGAVEVVLDRCNVAFNTRRQPIKLDRERIQKHVGDLAATGLRVLAFDRAELPVDTSASAPTACRASSPSSVCRG
jgi:magnesium-transporting ATPase (P-type)